MPPPPAPDLLACLRRHWGFSSLRPLQEQAIAAVLAARDSLVVLPTGGGKSLCYQLPAVATGVLTVVVSPLISLMKDQVDALTAIGVPSVQAHSGISEVEWREAARRLRRGEVRLLYCSPERLAADGFSGFLHDLMPRAFAIDEAHCISHWGHDFRPEYRQLARLRQRFPAASLHAYTATATPPVRRDIAAQLALNDPLELVGTFDRPNLVYRVLPRVDLARQLDEILARHRGEAGIVYCIRRADVDGLVASLGRRGFDARAYHAGLAATERRSVQEAFASERANLIVATVAFGMGIDRPDIRFVVHTACPKSVEHYQQETGRAGRDGLEAECTLLYSGRDVMLWRTIIERSAEEAGADPTWRASALTHLAEMDRYARGAVCRHRALSRHFGQELAAGTCDACDLCLGDVEEMAEATVVAQKILSCVARVGQRFGIEHVLSVLKGDRNEKVLSRGHESLSTHGILSAHPRTQLRDWIYQLVGAGALALAGDPFPVLSLNEESWQILRGQQQARLVGTRKAAERRPSRIAAASREGVDEALFESLRVWRRALAAGRGVPSFVILSDAALRDIARRRPQTPAELLACHGIGEVKLGQFGESILAAVRAAAG